MNALPELSHELSAADHLRYRFGPFTLVPSAYTLTRRSSPVPIGARALSLLIYFVARPGRVIDKAELIRAVWEGRAVEENNLAVQLSSLRRRLGEGIDGASYIRTLAGRGYIFVAPVTREISPAAPKGSFESVGLTPSVQTLTVDTHPFVGRIDELADLDARLAASRIVMVTGVGGVGKSRFVREFASGAGRKRFPGGIEFLDLTAAVLEGAIERAILGPQGIAALDASDAVCRPGRLIVLDNADEAADVLEHLSRRGFNDDPDLKFLITSRERLPLTGGASQLRLSPLSVPPDCSHTTAERALSFDSIRLLVACAATHLSHFALGDDDAAAACKICRELDGIPLAIELVAPRLRVLGLRQIAERASDRFRIGAEAAAERPTHRRTLRAVYDVSFAKLTSAEMRQIARLAVFVGGTSLAGAFALAAGETDEWQTLDMLAALNDRSLVEVDISRPEPRYNLLRCTRLYTLEKIDPEKLSALRARHAAYTADLFAKAEEEWARMHSARWLRLYEPDFDNLRAALDWSLGEGADRELGQSLLAVSYPLWIEGFVPDLGRWFDHADACPTDTAALTRAGRVWLAYAQRRDTGRDAGIVTRRFAAERAVASFRETGETEKLAFALCCLASMLTCERAAARCLEEAERFLADLPTSKWHSRVAIHWGALLTANGDLPAALAAYDRALRVIAWIGDPRGLADATVGRAEVLLGLGRSYEALESLERLRERLPELWSEIGAPTLLYHLTLAKRPEAARAAFRDAFPGLRISATKDEVFSGESEESLSDALRLAADALALILAEAGAFEEATRLTGFARTAGAVPSRRAVRERLERMLVTNLPPEALERHRIEGQAWCRREGAEICARFAAEASNIE